MQFVFNGTLEELKENVQKRATAFHKDIVIYQYEPTVLQIGFFCQAHGAREKTRSFSFLLRYNLLPFTDTNSVICKIIVGTEKGFSLRRSCQRS